MRCAGPTSGAVPESMTARSVGEGAAALISRVPRPKGYDERQQARIDRAGWNLRATEFTSLRVAAVVAGVVVGWGLLVSIPVAVIAAVTAWILPNLILTQRIAAREAKFLSQLPDTLQLMAGALRAGYGILQAIDTVVQETSDPMSTEFQRVLTEARLGLPLEDSLQAMAERIDSDDFRWVAVAINIQRRVGGNLADLLETVSNTLREREMVRRQIQVLSAEGRLSAVILTLLPLFLGLYMFVVSRDYIGVMFERTIGWIMLGGAAALMVVGVFWMRKLVDIDV
jgi:tight adherence protein B